jgi:hypothetical protein
MSLFIPHPERLLLALDAGLNHEVRLIIYGRSAVWLGFENPPAAAATTQDVDAIIPSEQVQALADDMQFWDSRDAVNERFKSEGLYFILRICSPRAEFSCVTTGSPTFSQSTGFRCATFVCSAPTRLT